MKPEGDTTQPANIPKTRFAHRSYSKFSLSKQKIKQQQQAEIILTSLNHLLRDFPVPADTAGPGGHTRCPRSSCPPSGGAGPATHACPQAASPSPPARRAQDGPQRSPARAPGEPPPAKTDPAAPTSGWRSRRSSAPPRVPVKAGTSGSRAVWLLPRESWRKNSSRPLSLLLQPGSPLELPPLQPLPTARWPRCATPPFHRAFSCAWSGRWRLFRAVCHSYLMC